jgi:hypothetical protein
VEQPQSVAPQTEPAQQQNQQLLALQAQALQYQVAAQQGNTQAQYYLAIITLQMTKIKLAMLQQAFRNVYNKA